MMPDEREERGAERDTEMARIAAGRWFADEMEKCTGCREYVPWDELVALIGTPPICPACRNAEQERRMAEAMETASWPLGLS